MVRDLQEIRGDRGMIVYQRGLDLFFDVTWKQKAHRVILQPHHQRVVIGCLLHGGNILGPKHIPFDSAALEIAPALLFDDRNSARARLREQRLECGSLLIASDPQFSDTEILEHAAKTVEMIVMRVRKRYHIETLDSARPQVWRNDFLADVCS